MAATVISLAQVTAVAAVAWCCACRLAAELYAPPPGLSAAAPARLVKRRRAKLHARPPCARAFGEQMPDGDLNLVQVQRAPA